jgi:biopolymer transport protein TolR
MAQLHRGRRMMAEINVVPYIDVMLVLLIIFMVTAPLLTQGVKVDLPKASAEPLDPAKQEKPLILSINSAGELFLSSASDPKAPLAREEVASQMQEALSKNPETSVLVHADRAIPYGDVVDAMVVLQRAGAKKVGLVTDPLPEPKQRKG